jgi:hypothetical protein
MAPARQMALRREAQGYFVGRPMSGPELATWLRRLPERQPDLRDARLWAAMRP